MMPGQIPQHSQILFFNYLFLGYSNKIEELNGGLHIWCVSSFDTAND